MNYFKKHWLNFPLWYFPCPFSLKKRKIFLLFCIKTFHSDSSPVQQRAELCGALLPPLGVSVAPQCFCWFTQKMKQSDFPPIFYWLNYSKHTIVFTHTGLFSSLMFCNSYHSGLANFKGLNTWTVSHYTGLHNHWDQDWETKRLW